MTTDPDELIPDPQDLIPIELQGQWLAVPRGTGAWIFVQAFVLGAGVALTAGSFFASERAGWWPALPAALAVMAGNALVLRRRERRALAALPRCECPGRDGGGEV